MAPTHQVVQGGNADRISAGMTDGANAKYRGVQWRPSHKPEYHLYVFNASARTFTNFGKLPRSIPGVVEGDPTEVAVEVKDGVVIRTEQLADNQRYHYVTSFPQPILIPKDDVNSLEMGYIETDVRRYVVDLINPDNLGLTLDTVLDPTKALSVGNDLSQKGVFFSYTNPPLKEDLTKAVTRMEKYYDALLQKAEVLHMTDKVKLSDELGGNPDYGYAADYFGKDVPWKKALTRPVKCQNCGEDKKAGIKFHMGSFGALCVEPTQEAWQSVVDAGLKTPEQVPARFRKGIMVEDAEEVPTTKFDELVRATKKNAAQ